MNKIEFYREYSNEKIAEVDSAVVPRKKEAMRIGDELFEVVSISNVLDYVKFGSHKALRVCVELVEIGVNITEKNPRDPKGKDDLVFIKWAK